MRIYTFCFGLFYFISAIFGQFLPNLANANFGDFFPEPKVALGMNPMYIRGFTKFGIKVLWRLQVLEYLRTLHLKFQKARTKIEVVLSLLCWLSAKLLSWVDSYGKIDFWSKFQ
jgi:hypothetical protein